MTRIHAYESNLHLPFEFIPTTSPESGVDTEVPTFVMDYSSPASLPPKTHIVQEIMEALIDPSEPTILYDRGVYKNGAFIKKISGATALRVISLGDDERNLDLANHLHDAMVAPNQPEIQHV